MYDNIPIEVYTQIHQHMPIVCVDCVIVHEEKVLLIKRKREPMKDQWWFPGGRLFKEERVKNAVLRIVKSETSISICRPIYLGFDETVFKTDPFGHNEGTHTINFVYTANISNLSMMRVVLDEDHMDYGTFSFDNIYQSNMHPYVKRFSAMAEGVITNSAIIQ